MAVHTTWFQDPLLMPIIPPSQDYCPSTPFPSPHSLLQRIPFPPKKQSLLDMDLFFQSESEKLREMVMEEQRRQQRILLQNFESRIAGVVRQRDAELAMAKTRNREVRDLVAAAELEARLWERRAAENEAAVAELSGRLRRAEAAEESFCGGGGGEPAAAAAGGMGRCGACESGRGTSVVFLPCRHLCCCESCDVFLQLCPVCAAVKEDSLQVILPHPAAAPPCPTLLPRQS